MHEYGIEDYDAVRDDTHGLQFTDWYVVGELNVAHNPVDRHDAEGSETRTTVECIWEGESGDVRAITYHELARESNEVENALERRDVGLRDTQRETV